VLESGIPLLGICYGMQAVGYLMGAGSHQPGRHGNCLVAPEWMPDRYFRVWPARAAGRMSACAKEPHRQTGVFHVQAS